MSAPKSDGHASGPTSTSGGAASTSGDTAADEALAARIRTIGQSMAARFGEIVAVLARAPRYRHLSLADLEWLVLPPLLTNQCKIVSARVKGKGGLQVPLGLAFWAHVSPEVAAKLAAQQKDGAMFRLAPNEWKSGDIPWLLDIVAPPEVAKAIYGQLKESVFKGGAPRGLEMSDRQSKEIGEE